MRIFVFEHLCGGGMLGQALPPDMVRQGGAMLAAAVQDFFAAGMRVTSMLDGRVALALDGAQVAMIESPDELEETFDKLAAAADAVLVIAPECEQILETWSLRLGALDKRSLGSGAEAVAMCADKMGLCGRLLSAGVRTPATNLYRKGQSLPPLPAVFKPRFGAGCEASYVCTDADQVTHLPQRSDWIVQPLIAGRHASASLLVSPRKIQPLLAGEQCIDVGPQLHYRGGRIPLTGALEQRALALASKAAAAVPDLLGFVGVDLVLGEKPEQDFVIEINPRLTLSYVGLRKLCVGNLAMAMLEPEEPVRFIEGVVSFDAAGVVTRETAP